MGNFLTPLITEHLPDGRRKRIYELLVYKSAYTTITIPKDFITDGASIPKVAWSIVGSPWSGKYVKAAVLHDWLYRYRIFDRLKTDTLFIEAMKGLGVSLIKRRVMYRFVRLFGWISWNRYRRANKVEEVKKEK